MRTLISAERGISRFEGSVWGTSETYGWKNYIFVGRSTSRLFVSVGWNLEVTTTERLWCNVKAISKRERSGGGDDNYNDETMMKWANCGGVLDYLYRAERALGRNECQTIGVESGDLGRRLQGDVG